MAVGIELVAPAIPEPEKIEGVLRPTGYRILVQILPPDGETKKWKDLLFMPEEVRDREWAAQLWGKVIDLGPDAYQDRLKFPSGPWCKKDDYILMRPYSGTRFMVQENLYALINDDTVQAITTEPEAIERV